MPVIPIRIYLYAAAALAIGALLWHDKVWWDKARARKAEIAAIESTLAGERKNAAQLRADYALNQVTSHALQERLSAVERERREQPLARLRCLTVRVPGAAAEGRGAAGPDGAAAGREPEEVAFDPSADLDEYGADCAVIAERLAGLQEWERARAH